MIYIGFNVYDCVVYSVTYMRVKAVLVWFERFMHTSGHSSTRLPKRVMYK